MAHLASWPEASFLGDARNLTVEPARRGHWEGQLVWGGVSPESYQVPSVMCPEGERPQQGGNLLGGLTWSGRVP